MSDYSLINRYVFEKKLRIPGEPFDVNEDVDNFDIQILDYADDGEMHEEEDDSEWNEEEDEEEEDWEEDDDE